MSFQTLGLVDSLLDAIHSSGYTTPTPIQAQAIPAILSGQDVMAAAQTGTGKTAGFTLPLLQRLGKQSAVGPKQVRALVLTPTRELAAQVGKSIATYGCNENLRSLVVFGGVNISPQRRGLAEGVDILVATPGRLLDLYQQKNVKFDELEILVLDEADRMLDMGFIHDIRRILPLLPQERQTLMFSATFSNDIRNLARSICRDPIEVDVAPRNSTVETIKQTVYQLPKDEKFYLLRHLVKNTAEQVLVFSRTKHGANKLVKRLEKSGIDAAAIHGNKSQAQRTKALQEFKQDRIQVLVATDIAARGIDIQALSLVINFDLPNVEEDYVHRIGRTGRAGASGQAISLVGEDEKKLLKDIERFIQRKIEQATLPDFERNEAADDGDNFSVAAASGERPRKLEERRPRQRSQQNTSRRRRPGGDSGKQFSSRPSQNRPSQRSQQRSEAGANEDGRQGGQRKPYRNQRSRQAEGEFQPQQQRRRGPRNQGQGSQEQRGEQRGNGQRSYEQRGKEQRSQNSWGQQRNARRDEQSGNRAPSKRGNEQRRQGTDGNRSSNSAVSRISRFFGGGKRSARV